MKFNINIILLCFSEFVSHHRPRNFLVWAYDTTTKMTFTEVPCTPRAAHSLRYGSSASSLTFFAYFSAGATFINLLTHISCMHAASETICNRVLLSCTPLCGGTSQLPIHVCGKQICESRSLLSYRDMWDDGGGACYQIRSDEARYQWKKYSTNRHTQQGTRRIPRNKQQVTRQRFFSSLFSPLFFARSSLLLRFFFSALWS